jgi:hypothetical protein
VFVKFLAHEPPHDAEKPFTFRVLFGFAFVLPRGIVGRVSDDGRKQNRASGRQWQPSPPVMNALGVRPDAGHFVVRRSVVYFRQRQRDFDEFFGLQNSWRTGGEQSGVASEHVDATQGHVRVIRQEFPAAHPAGFDEHPIVEVEPS